MGGGTDKTLPLGIMNRQDFLQGMYARVRAHIDINFDMDTPHPSPFFSPHPLLWFLFAGTWKSAPGG